MRVEKLTIYASSFRNIAFTILKELAAIRREGKEMTYLRPDSKSQVTIEYDNENNPIKIDAIVVSTQHDDFASEKEMLQQIKSDVIDILVPRVKSLLPSIIQQLFNDEITYHVNPTGIFCHWRSTRRHRINGRKIIVDTYGGKGAHGGGAFSGKDPSKVDRFAAYATRHVAKNLVASGVADEALVQVAYAIGVAEPVGLYVNTFGTSKVDFTDGEIAEKLHDIFDMKPYAIEQRFG